MEVCFVNHAGCGVRGDRGKQQQRNTQDTKSHLTEPQGPPSTGGRWSACLSCRSSTPRPVRGVGTQSEHCKRLLLTRKGRNFRLNTCITSGIPPTSNSSPPSHKQRTFPAKGMRKGSVQYTLFLASATRDALTAMDSSMGNSGGMTLVMIITQFSTSLKRSRSGSCVV